MIRIPSIGPNEHFYIDPETGVPTVYIGERREIQASNGAGGGIAQNWQKDAAAGLGYIKDSIKTAQSGIGLVAPDSAAMRGDAASMRNQAQLVNTQAGKVNNAGDALAALVPKLDPYATKLGNYGDDLYAQGQSLADQAKDVFGQGGALVNMDPSAGGIAGEFIKYWNSLSPDRYVSQAASDTQSSYQNAMGQAERDLSRRGVSATSGAFGGLKRTATQAMATALAAAKTKARQTGLDQQAAQLDKMVSAANTLYNMGKDTQQAALSAQGLGIDAQKGAAGIVQAQGGLLGDVGKLRSEAGQLYANAANIFGNAASVVNSAANLDLSALKNLQAAQQAAADYYLKVANSSRGGGGGGFTTSSNNQPEGDWMNWKNTGHSESWNKNHNPDYWSLANNNLPAYPETLEH